MAGLRPIEEMPGFPEAQTSGAHAAPPVNGSPLLYPPGMESPMVDPAPSRAPKSSQATRVVLNTPDGASGGAAGAGAGGLDYNQLADLASMDDRRVEVNSSGGSSVSNPDPTGIIAKGIKEVFGLSENLRKASASMAEQKAKDAEQAAQHHDDFYGADAESRRWNAKLDEIKYRSARLEDEKQLAKAQGQYAQWVEESKKLKLDPDRAWRDMTGDKGYKAALLGIMASIPHYDMRTRQWSTSGNGWGIIQQAITQDIENQKYELERHDKRGAEYRNMMEYWRSKGLDDRQAEALERVRLNAAYKDLADGLKMRAAAPQIRAAAAVASAQFDTELGKWQVQASRMIAPTKTSHGSTMRRMVTDPVKQAIRMTAARQLLGVDANGKPGGAAAAGGAPGGAAAMKLSKDERKADQTYQLALGKIGHMEELYNNWKSGFGDLSEAGFDYNQHRKKLGIDLWRLFDSGRLTDSDVRMALSTFFPAAEVRGLWSWLKKRAGRIAFTELKSDLQERWDLSRRLRFNDPSSEFYKYSSGNKSARAALKKLMMQKTGATEQELEQQ